MKLYITPNIEMLNGINYVKLHIQSNFQTASSSEVQLNRK